MGWGRGGRHKREVKDFSGGANGKEPACQCRRSKRCGFSSWVGKIPWRVKWQPSPVFLPGESHGERSLAGCSPWGHREWGTTEHAYPASIRRTLGTSHASSQRPALTHLNCKTREFHTHKGEGAPTSWLFCTEQRGHHGHLRFLTPYSLDVSCSNPCMYFNSTRSHPFCAAPAL